MFGENIILSESKRYYNIRHLGSYFKVHFLAITILLSNWLLPISFELDPMSEIYDDSTFYNFVIFM